MNYREKIRKAIECPQFGNETYGEWGILNLEQRKYIKRLLDELDSADNYIKNVYLENQELKLELSGYRQAIIKDKEMLGLKEQIQKYKEVIDKVIEKINKYESIKVYYEYIDEDGYDEYNYDEDFKKELLDILKEVSK